MGTAALDHEAFSNADFCHACIDETRVLIIYSGGTIGMLESPQGKRTYPGFLFDNLSSQARFHDPGQNTIFSHSTDIQTFREWRRSASRDTSRAPSPLPAGTTRHAPLNDIVPSYLTVMANGESIQLPSLRAPKSSGRPVRYCVYEYEHLIDSSDVGFDDWIRMASDIEANYKLFDSFIILHGTDTMAYTASALSFMLEHLGKPVILTGAQIPLSESRNDAIDNLLGALAIAGNFVIPEVTLFFHHTLYRGCRSTKSSSSDFEAFSSPNMQPLARVGINIDIDWRSVIRPTSLQPFCVHKALCANVATLRLFPGMTTASVKALVGTQLQGIVLSTFGAGNCPQRKDLLDAFREASERGVVIVNVTQCQTGAVAGSIYENGRKLEQAGVVGGADMTIECALAKLSYLLAKGLPAGDVRQLMSQPLRGELTPAKPASSDLVSSKDSRIRGLFSRLYLLSDSAQHFSQQSDLGGNGYSIKDVMAIEDSINPLLLNAAAARRDDSLKIMLGTLLDNKNIADNPTAMSSQGLSLLNTFATVSPLHTACLHGIASNVGLLVSHGASVHQRDIQGHSPLYYAATSREASHSDKLEMVKLIRSAGGHLGASEYEASAFNLQPENAEIWAAAGAINSS